MRHLAVTPSGSHLVSGGDDGEVKVWVVTNSTLGSHEAAGKRRPHLAHRRTIHTGRGSITNLAIKQISREVSLFIEKLCYLLIYKLIVCSCLCCNCFFSHEH